MSESRPATPRRPRVLSGIRPTGVGFQLGNYLGAVRHWAAMQDEAECFFFLADLHALTELPEPEQLRSRTRGKSQSYLDVDDPEQEARLGLAPDSDSADGNASDMAARGWNAPQEQEQYAYSYVPPVVPGIAAEGEVVVSGGR